MHIIGFLQVFLQQQNFFITSKCGIKQHGWQVFGSHLQIKCLSPRQGNRQVLCLNPLFYLVLYFTSQKALMEIQGLGFDQRHNNNSGQENSTPLPLKIASSGRWRNLTQEFLRIGRESSGNRPTTHFILFASVHPCQIGPILGILIHFVHAPNQMK